MIVGACVSPARIEPVPDASPEARQTCGVLVDTEADLIPDPVMRTYARFEQLRFLVERFQRRHGALPSNLAQVSIDGAAERDPLTYDAWGERIRYDRGNDGYVLWSAGPDQAWDTVDDLRLRPGEVVPVVSRPRPATTRTQLEVLGVYIIAFRERMGRFPTGLDELDAAGLAPVGGMTDAWERPVDYRVTEAGFALRSAGRDGVWGTGDDEEHQGPDPRLLDGVISPEASERGRCSSGRGITRPGVGNESVAAQQE